MKKRNAFIIVSVGAIVLILVAAAIIFTAPLANQKNVDEQAFNAVAHTYQAVEKGDVTDDDYVAPYWCLYIGSNDEDAIEHYFTIYDNGAGNPGVCGEIIDMDNDSIEIEVNKDMFEALPTDWRIKNNVLEVSYKQSGDAIILTNSGESATFLLVE